ncbi:ATP-dependent nuclease [Flavobacterium sp. AG291]|uniref:ATP-dependent nuclease n=1 Tax=Flavobacterium sp. AG291 TaxID=2184000 RepID=UPI000E0A7485|nr:AAA family ATPase [Flavobacterium sp. AG291]RDI10252.1 AAA ATPase-like protein [Flavobacterium sp. AG291]
MKLEYFYIKGFRRIYEAKVLMGDATFLIGENNIGKSSVLKAIETFFSETQKLSEQDFFKTTDDCTLVNEVIMEAKFIDLPAEAKTWKGFKGRIIEENVGGKNSNCIYYRKTFSRQGNVVREMKCFDKTINSKFSKCKSPNDYISAGIEEDIIKEVFSFTDGSKSIPAKEQEKLELISEIWDVNEVDAKWANNPGGIEGNISIRLPKFLIIPAEYRKDDIEGKTGTLQKMMKELFEDVREISENYKLAQHYLNLLASELSPDDDTKEFGKMVQEINTIIGGVFTETKIHIETLLGDASSITPSFDIEMSSNVRTKPERQGMGSIRSTVFALLRYRENFVERKRMAGVSLRPLIIGFEEPEMYLHPNAAALMREKIYELATSTNSKIICTTHSPYMIDLSKKIDDTDYPKQVLNSFKLEFDSGVGCFISRSVPFNTTEAYRGLQNEEKQYVKFILKIDDNIAKVFFCKRIIIVEGDTEEILLKETVNRLPDNEKKRFLTDYQIVKARGKATIISLVKYLRAMSITPFVIHDEDTEPGAVKFNDPILQSLEDEKYRFMVKHTIEDLLEYPEPSSEKPYRAYEHISKWGSEWKSIPNKWKTAFETYIAPELFDYSVQAGKENNCDSIE